MENKYTEKKISPKEQSGWAETIILIILKGIIGGANHTNKALCCFLFVMEDY